MSARGIERERRVRALLEDADWWTCRAAGSIGDADVVGLRVGSRPKLVEVKSTSRPFERFGPDKRERLLLAGRISGADVVLCWWPARARAPHWIPVSEWPGTTTSNEPEEPQ